MSHQLVISEKGKESGVILSLKDYNKLKEMAEDLANIKAYDKAKAGLKVKDLFHCRML